MFNIIGIIASLILGAFVGRIACNLMNKNQFAVNPMICTIFGVIGGALGSWLAGSIGIGGGLKLLALQIAAGMGVAFILLVFVYLARDKKEEINEDLEDEEEEESK